MPDTVLNGVSVAKTCSAEYPAFGRGDFRSPAVCVEDSCGRRVNELLYKSHEIFRGVPSIPGLPYFDRNAENAETLKIILSDSVTGFEAALFYSVFEAEDAVTRHTVITNVSDRPLKLCSAESLSIDFESKNFELLTLHGAWAGNAT
ncbi:MAG: glycoside hydrolase family 36 N-terminal domain-containing protein [Oscillospiraceae bacterium]